MPLIEMDVYVPEESCEVDVRVPRAVSEPELRAGPSLDGRVVEKRWSGGCTGTGSGSG